MAVLACTAALAFATPSMAAMVTMKADLKTGNEVPPVNGSGAGSVDLTYDSDSKKLSWKGSYSGLTGPATAAHFHGPAEPSKNAGVVVPIFAAAAAKSPFEGSATLTDAQASDLMAGRLYVNIHTDANKAGEIRGQVTK
jgi:Cu/Zn superoxide dismutase